MRVCNQSTSRPLPHATKGLSSLVPCPNLYLLGLNPNPKAFTHLSSLQNETGQFSPKSLSRTKSPKEQWGICPSCSPTSVALRLQPEAQGLTTWAWRRFPPGSLSVTLPLLHHSFRLQTLLVIFSLPGAPSSFKGTSSRKPSLFWPRIS